MKLKILKIRKYNIIKKLLFSIQQILGAYSKSNEITLLLQKKNIVMGSKDIDITSDILIILNKNIKEINFKMKNSLNKNEIIELLPHREPMLLIDELNNIKKTFFCYCNC